MSANPNEGDVWDAWAGMALGLQSQLAGTSESEKKATPKAKPKPKVTKKRGVIRETKPKRKAA